MGCSISSHHQAPPNPDFTFFYNIQTSEFSPSSVQWVDIETHGCDTEFFKNAAIKKRGAKARISSLRKPKVKLLDDICNCTSNPCTCTWTWTYEVCTADDLGVDPSNDPSEDPNTYYYYVATDPSVRTPDITVGMHYRGNQPSASDLSGVLGTDLFRAICWKESTWRQFLASGKPLCNINGNGSADWGYMQINSINNVIPIEIWDYRANIAHHCCPVKL